MIKQHKIMGLSGGLLFLALCTGLLTACSSGGNSSSTTVDNAADQPQVGNGGGGNPKNPGNEVDPPVATIIFPGTNALLTEHEITIRGTVTDASKIVSVSINGSEAVLDTSQDPVAWQLSMSLPLGVNVLNVRTEDEFGNVNETAATAKIKVVNTLIPSPEGIAVGPHGNYFVVNRITSSSPGNISKIDPQTGIRTIISNNLDGNPNALSAPQDIAVAPDGAIIVVDSNRDAVIQIDPTTGARTILSGPDPGNSGVNIGSGVALSYPTDIAIFHNSQDLLVTDSALDAVIKINRSTGDRTIVSATSDGKAAPFNTPAAIAISQDDSSYFVLDLGKIIRVDANGDRSILVEYNAGGKSFNALEDIAVGLDGSLYVGDAGGTLFKINPSTGTGIVLSEYNASDKLQFSPMGVAVEADGNLVVVSNFVDAIFHVDAANGQRTLISDATIGAGEPYYAATDITVKNNGDIIVADANNIAVVGVDPSTGDRTILSGVDNVAVAVDGDNVYALSTWYKELYRIDSGTASVISNASIGSGDPLVYPYTIATDDAGKILIANADLSRSSASIISVDPLSGDRTLISGVTSSGAMRGDGDPFSFPEEITRTDDGRIVVSDMVGSIGAKSENIVIVDPASGDRGLIADGFNFITGLVANGNNQVYVLDENDESIYSVKLATGERTIISNSTTGNGIVFDFPTGIGIEPTGMIVVSDHDHGAVIRIDPLTGDRAIISH